MRRERGRIGRFGVWRGAVLLAALIVAAGAWVRATAADEPVILLTIRDHRFEPAELAVPAGVKFKLVVKNADATPEEFESHDLNREKVIPGGGEGVLFIGPLKPGTYTFFGDFNSATAQGRMIAK